jgi:hypothetical protein
MKDIKIHSWLIFLVTLLALLAFWCFYPIFFQWLIVTQFKINPETYGKNFGAVGDTYGSLNTLVSSLALAGVVYSLYFQSISSKEAKQTSNNSALTDQFYALMTFKNEMFYQLKFEKILSYDESRKNNNQPTKMISGFDALNLIAEKFRIRLILDDEILDSKYSKRLTYFEKFMDSIFVDEVNSMISYFYIHGELIKLINNAEVSEEVKESLKSILRNTMLQEEQIVLFYFASIFKEINFSLKDSEIFNKFHYPTYHRFALKFHNESHFKSDGWKELFKENPTQPEPSLFD